MSFLGQNGAFTPKEEFFSKNHEDNFHVTFSPFHSAKFQKNSIISM